MKDNIKREDINYNFLKNIIIRFDFDGMEDAELDIVLSKISPELKEKGYTSRTKEISKEMDLNIEDPETIESNGIAVKNIRQQSVYVFKNKDPQVILKLSSTFAFISINKTKYVNCLDYCDVLLYVMNTIADNITYFSCRRFGLRKINQCFLMDITKLNDYFESRHYHLFSFGDNSKAKVTQLKDSLSINDFNVNLVRTIIRGEVDGTEAYQINFDSDIYVLGKESFSDSTSNNAQVSAMNEILFKLYKDVLTEQFLKQLIEGSFNNDVIKEVLKND